MDLTKYIVFVKASSTVVVLVNLRNLVAWGMYTGSANFASRFVRSDHSRGMKASSPYIPCTMLIKFVKHSCSPRMLMLHCGAPCSRSLGGSLALTQDDAESPRLIKSPAADVQPYTK